MAAVPGYVYRAFDADGALLYVGVTMEPRQRLRAHRHTAAWWAAIANVTIEHFPSREAALAAERVAIHREHPRHNVLGNELERTRPSGDGLPTGLGREELTTRLRDAVAKVARARSARDTASKARDSAIRRSAKHMPDRRIAELTGLSLARINQIRRGARL